MGDGPRAVLTRPAPAPDTTLHYGTRPEHVADVYLPDARADIRTLVLVVHGGFWRVEYDRTHLRPMCHALARTGATVASIEFRRTGQPGGGWPGTFDDVALAMDTIPQMMADAVGRPLPRLVLLGHSAGGHLATWAVSRPSLPPESPWFRPDAGANMVVDLAGVCDLRRAHALGLDDDATGLLMGGGPDDVPDRYAVADPAALPPAAPVVVLHGSEDDRVPVEVSRSYVTAVRAAGAGQRVRLVELPGVEHFALIDPLSPAWPAVLAAVRTPH
jgi:acetyl esterase/lipase